MTSRRRLRFVLVMGMAFTAGFVVLAPTSVDADIIHLKNGGKVEGTVESESGGVLTVKTRFGRQKIPRANVDRIEKAERTIDVYERKRKALDEKDAKAVFALAQWCRENSLSKQARTLLERTVTLDPRHEEAQTALGNVLHEGEWMTPEERAAAIERAADAEKRARGLVLYEGEWVPKEVRDAKEQGLVQFEGRWISPEELRVLRGLVQDEEGQWVHRDALAARAEAKRLEKELGLRLRLHDTDHFLVRSALDKKHIQALGEALEKGHTVFHRTFGIEKDLLKHRLLPVIEVEERRKFQQFLEIFAKDHEMSEAWLGVAQQAIGTYHFDPPLIAEYLGSRSTDYLVNGAVNKLGRILANLFYYNFNYLPAWFEEGMAVWLEVEVCGNCTTYYLGAPSASARGRYSKPKPDVSKRFDPNKGWILHGEWILMLRDAVDAEEDTPIHRLLYMEATEFGSLDIAKCWSFIDYWVREEPENFVAFIRLIREKMPRYNSAMTPRQISEIQEKAFKEAFGRRLIELEEEWESEALVE